VARESGYGSPGRESSGGELQGRERHGRRPRSVGGHGERRGPKGLARSKDRKIRRVLAETVERGKNPEDGTDEGLAILVPHVRPRGSAWWRRGTRRSCVRGSKNPRRGEPAGSGTTRLLLGGAAPAKGRAGGSEARGALERTEPQKVDRGTSVLRQGTTRNTPRSSRTTWGERRKPIKRYSPGTTRP